MKYVDEYRDPEAVRRYAEAIRKRVRGRWNIMEVCGGQTHAIARNGLQTLLPEQVRLLHGPGCPVCVTPAEMIDQAVALALRPGVILCSFGDMMRVPGSGSDLLTARAEGGDARVVYSPMDALALAEKHPDREVVFFAVGFETTAPANAGAVYQAARRGVSNFSLLASHVLVPPALETILADPDNVVHGFLAAGHVCTVMGLDPYRPIAERHRVPIVVTGFEPLDIMQGVHMCVRQLEEGRAEVENQYARSVAANGNPAARNMIAEVFRVVHRRWRGFGEIPLSGLALNQRYAAYDAVEKFSLSLPPAADHEACMSGMVLRGRIRPDECPEFAAGCTPERPLGAPMVSGEGACSAYYRYRAATAGQRNAQEEGGRSA